jgi:translation elongation factor EF-Ts
VPTTNEGSTPATPPIKKRLICSSTWITRVCEYCENDFIARITVTKFCGNSCAERVYKQRNKEVKIHRDRTTGQTVSEPLKQARAKKTRRCTLKEMRVSMKLCAKTY